MADLGIYVYGLVADGALAAAPELPGIDGDHAIECVREGDLCALVSRVGLEQFEEHMLREHLADMAWVEQTARRHQQVLDAVLDHCTPLPMRLCTLYGDEDGLRQMLDDQQEDLCTALNELRGKLEWGVQIFAGSRPASGSGCSEPTGSAPASGTSYLQQKLALRQAAEREHTDAGELCDRVHEALSTLAVAGRLGTPQRPEVSGRELPMVLNAFYLVRNEQRSVFIAEVEELRPEMAADGLELQLTGPWPPYNFVAAPIGGRP